MVSRLLGQLELGHCPVGLDDFNAVSSEDSSYVVSISQPSHLGRGSVVGGVYCPVKSRHSRHSAGTACPQMGDFRRILLLYPGADVHGLLPLGLLPVSSRLEANPRGVGASVTYDFNRWLGITLDTSTLWNSGEVGVDRVDDTALSNLSIGPKFTFRHRRFSPFLEALVGDHRLMPDAFHNIQKLGFMAGGGLDLNLTRHIALRLLRADFVFSNYRYGPPATTPETEIRGVRLQTGLNFTFGGGPPALPPSATCSVEPAEVFAGEPVNARSTGSNFNPHRKVQYTWNGSGVSVAGTNPSTQVDTAGLQPGAYTVNANLTDGSKRGVATCAASFAVKRPHPPEISCTANPSTVTAGNTASIRSEASSPDQRRLSYTYTSSAGSLSGTDATSTLDTRGAQPGPITVTCNVSDDRNPAYSFVNHQRDGGKSASGCSSRRGHRAGSQAYPAQYLLPKIRTANAEKSRRWPGRESASYAECFGHRL